MDLTDIQRLRDLHLKDVLHPRCNFDSCIIFNAITKNDVPYDDWEMATFVSFTRNHLESHVDEYFDRSQNIISRMRELNVDDDKTWIDIDETLIEPIMDAAYDDLAEMHRRMKYALETLELRYGVE